MNISSNSILLDADLYPGFGYTASLKVPFSVIDKTDFNSLRMNLILYAYDNTYVGYR